MPSKRLDPWTTPKTNWEAVGRLTLVTTAMENARPQLAEILSAGPDHPCFHNLVGELRNLEYEIRCLAPKRDPDTGEIKRPQ